MPADDKWRVVTIPYGIYHMAKRLAMEEHIPIHEAVGLMVQEWYYNEYGRKEEHGSGKALFRKPQEGGVSALEEGEESEDAEPSLDSD